LALTRQQSGHQRRQRNSSLPGTTGTGFHEVIALSFGRATTPKHSAAVTTIKPEKGK
jgi:hypothetical protein